MLSGRLVNFRGLPFVASRRRPRIRVFPACVVLRPNLHGRQVKIHDCLIEYICIWNAAANSDDVGISFIEPALQGSPGNRNCAHGEEKPNREVVRFLVLAIMVSQFHNVDTATHYLSESGYVLLRCMSNGPQRDI